MIYATQDGATTLIVAAAPTLAALEACYTQAIATPTGAPFVSVEQPGAASMLLEARFAGLRKPPYVFTFADTMDLQQFVAVYALQLIPAEAMGDRQRAMFDALADDPYVVDTRRIDEIAGLTTFDPWDQRSDAEKQQDVERQKAAAAAIQAGKMSGDSFTPKRAASTHPDSGHPAPDQHDPEPSAATVQVTDIRSTRRADGSISIDTVLAVKRAAGLPADAAATAGLVLRYYRLDVTGADLAALLAVVQPALLTEGTIAALEGADGTAALLAQGQAADGAWIVCATRSLAAWLQTVLRSTPAFAVAQTEIYAVNGQGERWVPKGISLVEADTTAEPPRPWNEGAAAWAALDAAARNTDAMRMRGQELLFCGSYRGASQGCIVMITPRRYFKRTGTLWDGAIDASLLPTDLKPVATATYRTQSRDWSSLSQELSRRGLVESLALQLYLNGLD